MTPTQSVSYQVFLVLVHDSLCFPRHGLCDATRSPGHGRPSELWDASLVGEGLALLERSATGDELTQFHIEAAMAAVHAGAPAFEGTDWPAIVSLYDRLMHVAPSPVVALNRAIAIGQCSGAERVSRR